MQSLSTHPASMPAIANGRSWPSATFCGFEVLCLRNDDMNMLDSDTLWLSNRSFMIGSHEFVVIRHHHNCYCRRQWRLPILSSSEAVQATSLLSLTAIGAPD